MGKAYDLKSMVNTLDLNPLCIDGDISDFYVDATDARGADATRRMEYILRNGGASNKKFLFAGHTGSGKSTELFKLAEQVKDKYMVIYFSIAEYVNFIDVSCSDLVLSMLKTLVDVVEKNGINVDRSCMDDIIAYWNDETIITNTEEEKIQMSAEVSAGASIYKIISAKIKAIFQQSNTIKTQTTSRIDKTMPQFLALINRFINGIKATLQDKDLLIIVDDLDKLGEKEASDIFKDHSVFLTSIETNIIYTFPVFMHYNKDYRYISMNFDESVILSMIMIDKRDGNPHNIGRDTLEKIVLKRANEALFESGCIKFAVEKSGGSIRNMLRMLRLAAVSAGIRCEKEGYDGESSLVTMNDIRDAYIEIKNSMKRVILEKYVNLLKEIHQSKDTVKATDTDMIMYLFRVFAIIEYNCERWCDLNPAVLDYLKEIREIEEES